MILRTRNDIAKYDSVRYNYSAEIAEVWFDIVEKIQKDGNLKEFKQEIANTTLIGEYIGSP